MEGPVSKVPVWVHTLLSLKSESLNQRVCTSNPVEEVQIYLCKQINYDSMVTVTGPEPCRGTDTNSNTIVTSLDLLLVYP